MNYLEALLFLLIGAAFIRPGTARVIGWIVVGVVALLIVLSLSGAGIGYPRRIMVDG